MMNIKDYATEVFNSLDENQLLEFINVFADENTLTRFETYCVGKRLILRG